MSNFKYALVKWKEGFINLFVEVYERHETNMATVFELMVYVLIEAVVTPLRFISILFFWLIFELEDRLGKPKTNKESKKERAL